MDCTRFPLRRAGSAISLALALCLGCGDSVELVPVRGRVFCDDQPLQFGSVTFQPSGGKAARGSIQPDGTFQLTTFRQGDGAVAGRHRVRVTCYTLQNPKAALPSAESEEIGGLGEALIPEKYANYATSGLVVDVQPAMQDEVVIRLSSD
jgi:hypothetical protein